MIRQPTTDNITVILGAILADQGPLDVGLRWWPMTMAHLQDQRRIDVVAKLGGSVGLSVAHVHRREDGIERFELAHAACVRTDAVLTLNYSPWMEYWGQKDARGWNGQAAKEIEAMAVAFKFCRDLLWAANEKADADVRVDTVFLNQEILRADLDENGKPDPFGAGVQDEQAMALRLKNNIAWQIVKEHFPEATTVYSGQLTSSHHVDGERTDGVAHTELYIANQLTGMELQFRRLLDAVDDEHVENPRANWPSIMPFIGIGGHYRHGWATKPGWTDEEPYMPGLTWEFAQQAMHKWHRDNQGGGPDYKRATLFGIWPTRNDLKWWTHFIALVAGAHNLKEFENDWPKIPV